MEPTFRLRFLGAVQITQDDQPVRRFESRKALALLGYLAAQSRPIPREQLVDLFWGDKSESRGRANLSWVLNRIATLLPDCVQADRHDVQFQRGDQYWLDIDVLAQLETRRDPDSLAAAVALYRGEFLEGLSLDGCAEFELWLVGERERWRQRAVQALETLISHHGQRGEREEGLRFARHLLTLEPWREDSHRQVMRLLARSGQRSAALAQYETCCRVLADELGVDPLPETTALYERIQTAARARKPNLPVQPTRFVGREEDLAQVASMLNNPECRLLTILGSGGVGKTRLALQAAANQTETFLEGVFFVPLASLSSAEHLTSAMAEAIGFSFSGHDAPKQQVLNYLRGKEMLLILDNFEHLLEGAEFVAEILRRAPEITLLVTSREPLNLRWEWRFEIKGLPYPAADETPDLQGLSGYSAIQLFEHIARRARPRFQLATHNQPAVIRVCHLVEGLPLGIEMAAAWVGEQTCAQIAEEIENSLGFLATSMRDVPERHRSLRATFEHSWRLLSPQEQHAFAILSVFRGGFQPKAAGEVIGGSPDVLQSLAAKSLLRCLPSGRCEMHELLRQYAAEKLSAQPEVEAKARDRHCTHYTTFLKEHESDLNGKHVSEALAAIKPEIANVRAAWHWAVQEARLEDIERGLTSLSRYYLLAGPFQEGSMLIAQAVERMRKMVDQEEKATQEAKTILSKLLAEQANLLNQQGMYEQAIAAAQTAVDQARGSQAIGPKAMGYLQWGTALWCQGDYEAARSQLKQALALAQSAKLHQLEADGLRNLGIICWNLDDYAGARTHYGQALRICREIGDQQGEGRALNNLGLVAEWQGDYANAKAYLEQSLRIQCDLGDRKGENIVLVNLGLIYNRQGDFARAETYYEQALRICREVGDQESAGMVLSNLGLLAHRQGDYVAAQEFSRQALQLAQELGSRFLQGFALTHLGHALAGLGKLNEAAAAYQEAVDIRHELGQHNLAIESLAGLARVSLAQGDLIHAQRQADEILAHLQAGNLDGTIEPLWIYLTCYRVLKANDDPHAQEILNTAHHLLHEQAAKINDEEMRRSFLENVAAHREIIAAFESQSDKPAEV